MTSTRRYEFAASILQQPASKHAASSFLATPVRFSPIAGITCRG